MSDVEEESGESGSGKGLLIIGLVLGLGIGAGAAWFYFSGDEGTGDSVAEEPVIQMDVNIAGVRIPVFDNRGRYSGTIKIQVIVKVNAGEDFALAQGFSSQLKNDFLIALADLKAPSDESRTVHHPGEIAEVLLPVAQRVLGDIKVYAVHINDLEFQKR